ncbi:erv26 super protein [Xanthoria parietina]
MWVLPLIGYAGVLFGFGFLTLATASGLYYLSELVEEHTVFAKKLLSRLIYSIIALQVLLTVLDGFPVSLSLLSIGSHAVYAGNLRYFPIVRLTDPVFLLSCVLVILNHFLWFHHFSTPPVPSSSRNRIGSRYDYSNIPSFTDIASFFGICVWLVPFAMFVSLSAGENVLPSMGSEYATGDSGRSSSLTDSRGSGRDPQGKRSAKGLVKAAIDGASLWVGESGEALGLWRADKRRF